MPNRLRKRTCRVRQIRKKRTRKHRGGNVIESKIIEMLKNIQQDHILRSFQLDFKFKDIPYSTIFKLNYKKINDGFNLIISNYCINIDIEFDSSTGDSYSESIIRQNSSQPYCFSPRLTTINKPVRVTSVDVLQTLTTKIKVILYNNKYIDNIKLYDVSRIDNVMTLPYRVLRGLPAIYEKYGYISEKLNEFREIILPNATWEYIVSIDKHNLLYSPTILEIFEKFNKHKFMDDWKSHHISELLVNIPYEEEQKHNISLIIMKVLTNNTLSMFVLDQSSIKWKEWNTSLEFTGFDVVV